MTAVDSSPGRAHASPDCLGASPGPLCGLLGAGQSPVWACSWGPLLRPCLLHSTEAAGVRCRRAENHGLALSQSFPSILATLLFLDCLDVFNLLDKRLEPQILMLVRP